MEKSTWKLFPEREGIVPYIALANCVIPLFFMLREPLASVWPGLLLFVVFLAAYREQFWRVRYVQHFLIVQLAIILFYVIAYEPGSAYLGFILSLPLSKQRPRFIMVVAVVFAAVTTWASIPYFEKIGSVMLFILIPPIFGVCIMPFIIRNAAKFKTMAERLKAATEQLERMAQQEERQRIARELHDTLGHTLSLIALKGELTEKLIPRAPEKAMAEARELTDTARAALKQMRELVTEMRVVRLAEEYAHARSLCAAAGIALMIDDRVYDVKADKTGNGAELVSQAVRTPLSPLQETILAMSFREVLTNVVRHSRATECRAELEIEEGSVILRVTDNGQGMDEQEIKSASGSGIAGLRQRLMLVDGHLTIQSAPHAGMRIGLHIPRTIRSHQGG
ncbi:sensor histidine kinase [Paenibacillus guangzhouensis]|uniref:sensor histidine kinase n=1 Tax=Paenibacillus guangzhouensis TaxID=1473112 RepID=UPI001266FFD2|nr:sensor histidine kinase [Paenibacillus guangzhouensis]